MTVKPDSAKNEGAHLRAQELISAYVDDDLTQSEKERFESHLAECEQCCRDVEILRQTVEWLGQMPVQPLPRSFMIPESEARGTGFAFDWLFPYLRAGAVAAACVLVFVLSADLFQATLSTGRLAQAPMHMGKSIEATAAPAAATTLRSVATPTVATAEVAVSDLPSGKPGTPQEETQTQPDSADLMDSYAPPGEEGAGEAVSLGALVDDRDGEALGQEETVPEPARPFAENESVLEEFEVVTEPDAELAVGTLLREEALDLLSADISPPPVEIPEKSVDEVRSAAPRSPDLTSIPIDVAPPAAPPPSAMSEEAPVDEMRHAFPAAPTLAAASVYTVPGSGVMSTTAPAGEIVWAQPTPPAMPTPPARARQEVVAARQEVPYWLLWRVAELSLLLIVLVCAAGAWVIGRRRSGEE